MESVYRTCRRCRRRQRVDLDTDGRGGLLETLPCGCEAQIQVGGRCIECRTAPIEGLPGRALRCGPCKAKARARSSAAWRSRHPDRVRARQDRENAKRRTPEGRAAARVRDRKRRADPEYRARRNRQKRENGARNPGKKAEQGRRYKAKYPERVREQQNRANAKRRQAARDYMHLYATKYVGEGKVPTCRGCGAEIEWNGRGRPRLDCPDCRAGKVRAA